MILRSYQEKLVTGLARRLAAGFRKIVGQLATGGGKTIIFSSISKRFLDKNDGDVLILVDRKELLKQTRRTLFDAFGIEAQVIKAGMKYIPPARVYVGMVESVNRRISKIKNIKMLIIDEAHKSNFNKLHTFFPEAYIIGFTATPLASSPKNPMNKHYEDIVCGVDIAELIADGHLCQNITFSPSDTVDRSTLSLFGNDFDEGVMGTEFSKPKYITNTVEAYEKHAKGTKTLIFNVNIAHSLEVNKAFTDAGYEARHVDGETPQAERDDILEWFKHTPGAILNNVGIATVGFDEPTIETVIVNKATMSLSLWLQMCGRGSRPTQFKSMFTIIDMGKNWVSHGDWSQSHDWEDIFKNPKEFIERNREAIPIVKSCIECEAIIPANIRTCPYCGHKYGTDDIPPEVALGEFIIVTKSIDVGKVIQENAHRKEYYPFWEIGRTLAYEAKKTVPEMSNEYANFILLSYFEKAKEWMKALHLLNTVTNKRKRLDKWHQDKAKDYLFTELKRLYPEWEIPQQ